MLHEMLSRVAREYAYQRAKPFAHSEFGNFVRRDISTEAKKNLVFLPFDLKVKASVGAGNWAAVPWLGFFDPIITESATSGFYVVYLINAQTEEIFLSFNQGTTAVYREYGEKRGQDVLRRRAIDMFDRIPSFAALLDISQIDLGSQEALPRGYMAGHAFGSAYKAFQIDSHAFYDDLTRMLSAYETLIDLGGTTPTDIMFEEANSFDIKETRRYILSKRIERAPNVRPRVLEARGLVCEGCGLDPELHLGYRGRPTNTILDIHHISPISHLSEGESRRYKLPDDFLVLCPTCHRTIHKQQDPSDIELLRTSINFTYSLKKH